MRSVDELLTLTSKLDARYYLLRGEMERTKEKGRFEHSENWIGPDGTPVQFTTDSAYARVIAAAVAHPLGTTEIRIATPVDLVRTKLRAAGDAERRKSKRVQDLADALKLAEDNPGIRAELTDAERARLDRA